MNKPRGRPFQPGNRYGKGRPKGSRNKVTRAARELLEQYSEALMRKCITMALRENVAAMRLCLERMVPIPREAGVQLKMPPVKTIADIGTAEQAVLRAISTGRIAPMEGEVVANVLSMRRKSIETDEIERRISGLEQAAKDGESEKEAA